jgi:hypothetical protein
MFFHDYISFGKQKTFEPRQGRRSVLLWSDDVRRPEGMSTVVAGWMDEKGRDRFVDDNELKYRKLIGNNQC